MTIVAYAGDIKVSVGKSGVILTKAGESWGDPWPVSDTVMSVTNVDALIQALQQAQREQFFDGL